MNWFSLLKVQRQTQRQGVSARQKDEEFIFEDEDDCYDEFIRIYENIKNFFPNAIREPDKVPEGQEGFSYTYDKFVVYSQALIPKKGEVPDEAFCAAIELYKNAKSESLYQSFKNYDIWVIKNSSEHTIKIFLENSISDAVAFISLDAYEREFIDGAYGPPSSAENTLYNIDQNIDGWRRSFI